MSGAVTPENRDGAAAQVGAGLLLMLLGGVLTLERMGLIERVEMRHPPFG